MANGERKDIERVPAISWISGMSRAGGSGWRAVALSKAGARPATRGSDHPRIGPQTASPRQSAGVMLIAKAVETTPAWATSTRFLSRRGDEPS